MRSEYVDVWGTYMCMSVYLLHSSQTMTEHLLERWAKDFNKSSKNKISKEPKPMWKATQFL